MDPFSLRMTSLSLCFSLATFKDFNLEIKISIAFLFLGPSKAGMKDTRPFCVYLYSGLFYEMFGSKL